ncbi:uncharacterized protein METZ01_LOCUS385621, partial [marine metagenome]
GKKMIVVSQENEKVRLKPYKSAVVKTPVVVKTVEPIPEGPKPEWESKKVVTEGVKNVQECLNPMGCPQDVKTGECLEGCSEQKVKIEMTETIIDPTNINVKNTAGIYDLALVLPVLLEMDPWGEWRDGMQEYFGKPAWLCIVAHKMGTPKFKTTMTRLIYSTPNLLETCNEVLPGESRRKLTPWTSPEIINSL